MASINGKSVCITSKVFSLLHPIFNQYLLINKVLRFGRVTGLISVEPGLAARLVIICYILLWLRSRISKRGNSIAVKSNTSIKLFTNDNSTKAG
jgi:hypothetical protein